MEPEYPRIEKSRDLGIYIALSPRSRLPGKFTNEHYAQVALDQYRARVAAALAKKAAKNKE